MGHGQYYLDGDNGGWSRDTGPAVTGQEITIAVRVLFSADPGAAVIDAWHNGEQTPACTRTARAPSTPASPATRRRASTGIRPSGTPAPAT